MTVNVINLLSLNCQNRIQERELKGTSWAASFRPQFLKTPHQKIQVVNTISLLFKTGRSHMISLFTAPLGTQQSESWEPSPNFQIYCTDNKPCISLPRLLHYNRYLVEWESFILQELASELAWLQNHLSSIQQKLHPSSC